VDLLLYDKLLINTPELIIPHPRMFERLFVIAPLDEIAPDILLSVFPQYQKENFINQNVQIWKGL
jgi:2-amino-4-hydroxy-6-hydroxymethyldihydropteridine diphosphokinase